MSGAKTKDSVKSPFSPSSLNLSMDTKTAEQQTKSPKPASNLMAAWLTKSASKKTESTSPSKKDLSKKKENSAPTKKSISSKLANAFDDEDEVMEVIEEAPVAIKQKEVKKPKKEATPEKKSEKVTKSTKRASKSPKEQVTTKASKTTKVVIDDAKEKTEKNAAAIAKEKKGGNKFYAAYMRREGPKNPGSKPVPIGKPGCFSNLKFLVTGVLESMDRDACKKIVEKYGGTCISGVTKKLDYLVVGEEPGQSKIDKAKELNIQMVSEDEFLQLICQKSGITNPTYEDDCEMMEASDEEETQVIKKELTQSMDLLESKKPFKQEKSEPLDAVVDKKPVVKEQKMDSGSERKLIKEEPVVTPKTEVAMEKPAVPKELNDGVSQLWVDKYKPTSMKRIIGQTGESSNAPKLLNWLKNWQKWHGVNADKSAKKGWNDQNTGSSFKCALLSGPPGIGKTTTATLVAKEAGYTYIELNASDSRSKKLLDKVLGESSASCSIDSYFNGKGGHNVKDVEADKHLIIMDEVDGMAGNEDRGGIGEMILKIKASKIPIICICNDRQHVKIRSLANHCFDLRFNKPGVNQIRAALMTVCFKEDIQIGKDLLDQIIIGCNYDIRQCLHNLSMWSSNKKQFTSDGQSKQDIESAMKDIKMNPFEACKQIFMQDPAKPKTINDKMEYFFCDYMLMPLLVQENYLSVRPSNLKGTTKSHRDYHHLRLLEDTSLNMCNSDRIGRLIRSHNAWSLMPTQAVFATLVPGANLQGSMGMAAFPGWFGKNSKQNRVDRILQELQKHMRIHISANKTGVGLEYLSVLKNMLATPLIRRGADGIDQVIKVMNEYSLTRDDFDTILELATWPGQKDPMSQIDSKVKAAFTRAFNKQAQMNAFTVVDVKKMKAAKVVEENPEFQGDVVDSSEEEEDDDVTKDSMIKCKTKSKTAAKTTKAAAVKRAAKADDSTAKPSASKKKKI